MSVKKVYFKTFGCRTNQFDTQVMMSKIKDYQLCFDEKDADIVVVNSCTVTNGADSSVRGYINKLNRETPSARVILAGCGSHSKGEEIFNSGKVFGVMGHSEKEKINELLNKESRFYEIGDLKHIDETIVEEFVGKTRAFIKIQEGCNFRCSYCIIPFVRGDARSHDEDKILQQIRKLAGNGFGEFILTGTNVGSYGKDKGSSMAKLLKKISAIRGVRRIRIGSIEPIQIDDEFKEILHESWMAKHLHIALQHTSDKMLEIMNRRNRFAEDLELFQELYEAGYALGTDFIVGHPGEGEKQWQEAMRRIELLPLTHIHAFTYSKRDGTLSANMKEPVVRGDIAKKRHLQLREAIAQKNYIFRKFHNKNLEVLVENGKDGIYHGYDQYYNKIEIKSNMDIRHNWIFIENAEVGNEKNSAKFYG